MKLSTTLIVFGLGGATALGLQNLEGQSESAFEPVGPVTPYESPLERAIHMVESSGRLTEGEPILGDYGTSRGPMQCGYLAWCDAVEHDPSIGGTYDMVDDLQYSLHIFRAYMDRYATQRRGVYNDYQRAAIWNGGPRGHHKEATRKYSERVVSLLQGGEL